MKLKQLCTEAETHLQGLDQRFQEFRPDGLDFCIQELSQVLESLQQWVAAPQPVDGKDREALKAFRAKMGALLSQADYGNHLCLGLMQRRMGVGYTRRGQPWVLSVESSATYEG